MLIRKLFKFENAHVVRNCSSDRCKFSIHGHSYKVEVILEAKKLDNGHMVLDFGLLKNELKELIDSFDHSTAFWDKDDPAYIGFVKDFSARWVSLPVNPSAEQLSRVIFLMTNRLFGATEFNNGEDSHISVHSVIVHETDTGYAQSFIDDVFSPTMGYLNLEEIEFSDAIKSEWKDPHMWDKLIHFIKNGGAKVFKNHPVEQQVVEKKD